MDTRHQILSGGRDILMQDGLRAITTNAVAQRARISKKTLYQHFQNKDQLLEEILVSFMEEHLKHWDAILERDEPPIDRILASLRFFGEFLPQIQTTVINQVETVAPQLWPKIDAIRVQRLQKLKSLVEEGQREGFVRCDINPDHWILLLTGTVRSVINPKVLLRTGISATELLNDIQILYFEGLLTDDGRQHIADKEI